MRRREKFEIWGWVSYSRYFTFLMRKDNGITHDDNHLSLTAWVSQRDTLNIFLNHASLIERLIIVRHLTGGVCIRISPSMNSTWYLRSCQSSSHRLPSLHPHTPLLHHNFLLLCPSWSSLMIIGFWWCWKGTKWERRWKFGIRGASLTPSFLPPGSQHWHTGDLLKACEIPSWFGRSCQGKWRTHAHAKY